MTNQLREASLDHSQMSCWAPLCCGGAGLGLTVEVHLESVEVCSRSKLHEG